MAAPRLPMGFHVQNQQWGNAAVAAGSAVGAPSSASPSPPGMRMRNFMGISEVLVTVQGVPEAIRDDAEVQLGAVELEGGSDNAATEVEHKALRSALDFPGKGFGELPKVIRLKQHADG